MASESPELTEGDLVFLWNDATKELDKEGVVNQVLDTPLKMGDAELPVGSIGVSYLDSTAILWIKPEYVSACIKKADSISVVEDAVAVEEQVPPVADSAAVASATAAPATDAATAVADMFKSGDKVVVVKDVEVTGKILGAFFGSLSAQKVQKGTKGVIDEVIKSGDLVVTFEGSWSKSQVSKEQMSHLELQVHQKKPSPTSKWKRSTGFVRGDRVHVRTAADKEWVTDAAVLRVADKAIMNRGMGVPAGSVEVSFESGRSNEWIFPDNVHSVLRLAARPEGSADGVSSKIDAVDVATPARGSSKCVSSHNASGSSASTDGQYGVGSFKKGEKVHMWHMSRKEWEHEAVIFDVLDKAIEGDNLNIPQGSLIVTCRSGAESHTIMPSLFDAMLRKEDHWHADEPPPSMTAWAATKCDGDGDVITSAVEEASEEGDLDTGCFQPPPRAGVSSGSDSPPAQPLGDCAFTADEEKLPADTKESNPDQSDAGLQGDMSADAEDAALAALSQVEENTCKLSTQKAESEEYSLFCQDDNALATAGAIAAAAAAPTGISQDVQGVDVVAVSGKAETIEEDAAEKEVDASAASSSIAPRVVVVKPGQLQGDSRSAAPSGCDSDDSTPAVPAASVTLPHFAGSGITSAAVSTGTLPPTLSTGSGGSSSTHLMPLAPISPAASAGKPTGPALGGSGTQSPQPPMPESLPCGPYDRAQQRVLVIGSGFGMELNPVQIQVVRDAGFQVHCVTTLPNPESASFPVHQFIPTITRAIEEFKPHVVACASKGGAYMTALWQMGLWIGPSLLINKHPSLLALPKDVTVCLCCGSNDEYYKYRRQDIEAICRTGSPNRVLLYYTGNSGLLGRGYTREGDRHNMASLAIYDCLPRLLDAVMQGGDPDMHLMQSWDTMVTEARLDAERWLGYSPSALRGLWQSEDQKGMDDSVLFEVQAGTEEYARVAALFRAQPRVPRAYHDMNPAMWEHLTIARIERVENGMQEDGNAEPYFRALQRGIENQGIKFKPGLHTRWAFHGSSAVEDIVSNPISGFQPLMSGSRASALWGPGTYFARDAKYVYDGGFCNMMPDGSRQILLCLVMTGMSCLGDPTHPGVLPVRHGRHRYNSSVDSLSNPEIWVTQNPGAAYPAYVITFH